MRNSTYRLLKRLIIFLPAVWIVYVFYELGTHDSDNNKFDNLPPNIEIHNPIDSDSQRLLPEKSPILQQLPIAKRDLDKKHSNREVRGKYINQQSIGLTDNIHYNTERTEKTLEESQRNKQQLDKLAELGGVLVQKRPGHLFAGVTLPVFNDKKDPSGPGQSVLTVSICV